MRKYKISSSWERTNVDHNFTCHFTITNKKKRNKQTKTKKLFISISRLWTRANKCRLLARSLPLPPPLHITHLSTCSCHHLHTLTHLAMPLSPLALLVRGGPLSSFVSLLPAFALRLIFPSISRRDNYIEPAIAVPLATSAPIGVYDALEAGGICWYARWEA